MAEESWMKMTFQGLATGGRKGVSGGETPGIRGRQKRVRLTYG